LKIEKAIRIPEKIELRRTWDRALNTDLNNGSLLGSGATPSNKTGREFMETILLWKNTPKFLIYYF